MGLHDSEFVSARTPASMQAAEQIKRIVLDEPADKGRAWNGELFHKEPPIQTTHENARTMGAHVFMRETKGAKHKRSPCCRCGLGYCGEAPFFAISASSGRYE